MKAIARFFRLLTLYAAIIVLSGILGIMLWERYQNPRGVQTPIGVLSKQAYAYGMERIQQFDRILIDRPAPAPRADQIVAHSHFNDPIVPQTVSWLGHEVTLDAETRRAGHTNHWVQMVCIELVRERLQNENFGLPEHLEMWTTDYALACLWMESWNNPYAAAGQSSAVGGHQFLDGTRHTLAERCGMDILNRIERDHSDFEANLELLIVHLHEQFRFVCRRTGTQVDAETFFRTCYGFHHDWTSYRDTPGSSTRNLAERVVERMFLIRHCLKGVV